jgi:phosphatidylinositol N-acetylglucosaminyltransferase subunit A
MSRLVYRKGVDLLVILIPSICRAHPEVDFIIGGDGPKRVELECMREQQGLHGRVKMLGNVPHHLVRSVLTQGDIFLNCSLTEVRGFPFACFFLLQFTGWRVPWTIH